MIMHLLLKRNPELYFPEKEPLDMDCVRKLADLPHEP